MQQHNIIGDKDTSVMTRSKKNVVEILEIDEYSHIAMLSSIEPKHYQDAKDEKDWIIAMKEELEQIEKNDTWILIPRPNHKNVIGSKWIFRNKLDEKGIVTKNKVRLVCKDFAQIAGLDYDETFALVA
ncbi:uncharacterized mitochondrial protein AtMg00820-like [Cornus florida]|uniref:uncharacterized mitochondrial protein AtMg00820-like n=1 Tax=Cornus florida TaxID=4283 RepID=UPI002898A361|nr:uncharacterized mitochondrial protein AtMg00820-like [Cornus florida]